VCNAKKWGRSCPHIEAAADVDYIWKREKIYSNQKSARLLLTPHPHLLPAFLPPPQPQQWEWGHKFTGPRNQDFPHYSHPPPRLNRTPPLPAWATQHFPSPHHLGNALFHSVSLVISADVKVRRKIFCLWNTYRIEYNWVYIKNSKFRYLFDQLKRKNCVSIEVKNSWKPRTWRLLRMPEQLELMVHKLLNCISGQLLRTCEPAR
jgi:hypothetical protein